MLVFGRKVGEEVMIGDDIVVKVVSVRGGRISLGFKAPPHVPINRREIYERLQEEEPSGNFGFAESFEPAVA